MGWRSSLEHLGTSTPPAPVSRPPRLPPRAAATDTMHFEPLVRLLAKVSSPGTLWGWGQGRKRGQGQRQEQGQGQGQGHSRPCPLAPRSLRCPLGPWSGCTPVLSTGSCPAPPTRCFHPLPPVPCPAPGSLRSPPAGPAPFPLNLAAGLSGTARPLPQRRAGCFPAGLWGLLVLPRGRGRILPTLQTPSQPRAGVWGWSPLPPSLAAL